MGFLDKVKDTANKVGEKAQEGIAAGKDKLEDAKLKKQVSDAKEAIGGIVYLQRTGAAPDDAEAQIDRLVQEITEAQAAIEAS